MINGHWLKASAAVGSCFETPMSTMGNIPACQSSFSSAGDWDYSAPQGASTSVLRVPFAKKNNRELTDAYDWYTMLAYDYERAVSEQVPIVARSTYAGPCQPFIVWR